MFCFVSRIIRVSTFCLGCRILPSIVSVWFCKFCLVIVNAKSLFREEQYPVRVVLVLRQRNVELGGSVGTEVGPFLCVDVLLMLLLRFEMLGVRGLSDFWLVAGNGTVLVFMWNCMLVMAV